MSAVTQAIIPHHAAWTARRRSERMAHWCIAPATLLMILSTLLPFAAVLLLSLTDYELGDVHLDWIGLGNFVRAAKDPDVLHAVMNTFVFAAMVVPTAVGLGLFLALLVNARTKTRRFYELLFFLPITATMTVMSVVWSFILHERIGPVKVILESLGLPSVNFFSDPGVVLTTLAFIAVWQHMCFCFIIFLAGLTAIPTELYEAAALDGADRGWEQFRRITWPQLAPTTLVVVVLTTIHTFHVFDLVVVLTQGGPAGSSEVILYKTYLEAFSYFRIGYGSALILIYVAMVGLISVAQFWFAKRRHAA